MCKALKNVPIEIELEKSSDGRYGVKHSKCFVADKQGRSKKGHSGIVPVSPHDRIFKSGVLYMVHKVNINKGRVLAKLLLISAGNRSLMKKVVEPKYHGFIDYAMR